MILRWALRILAASCLLISTTTGNAATVLILLRDGSVIEGAARFDSVNIQIDGRVRRQPLSKILSIHSASLPTPQEESRIAIGLGAIAGTNVKARDAAVAQLTDIGLPAMSPLLQSLKDRDMRQPDATYRLFARLMPGYADGLDRSLDLVRLKSGEVLRGKLVGDSLGVIDLNGQERTLQLGEIRRLAVKQRDIRRRMEVHSLLHSTQIEFADTGIILTNGSKLTSESSGHVRLDFDRDGWSSDPDGLKKPGPNYNTHLVDGFPFGALLGRIGVGGQRWFMGRSFKKSGLEPGRLYVAVNDNPHWQNNIGSFRTTIHATEAYDVGDAQ